MLGNRWRRILPTRLNEAFIERLVSGNQLDRLDIEALERIPIAGRFCVSQTRIAREGQLATECCLVIDGFVYRSKLADDHQRQILSLHLAGDIPDLENLLVPVMDNDLTTMTDCILGFMPHQALREICADRPNVSAALWRQTVSEAVLYREWMVNLGRRTALERTVRLLLEIGNRLTRIRRLNTNGIELPITQVELADCLGLSTVHVNRIIRQLRSDGFLSISRRKLIVLNEANVGMLMQSAASHSLQEVADKCRYAVNEPTGRRLQR